jgi:hypothetical protein
MKKNEFKCAHCGGVFEKARTDEEAVTESEEVFGAYEPEDLDVICGEAA